MRKFLFKSAFALAASLLLHTGAMAQGVFLNASDQEMAYVGKVYKGAGSPYLLDDWATGRVKLTDGTVYEGLKLMYDLLKDEPIFLIEGNKAQKFMYPVKEFTIQEIKTANFPERVYRNGFPAIDGSTEKNFYEILTDGNTKLVKRISKAVVEERAPNSRVATKQIKANERFYLYKGGQLVKIRKEKKSVLTALNDKSTEIEKYLQSKKVNLKDEEQFKAVIAYYNTL